MTLGPVRRAAVPLLALVALTACGSGGGDTSSDERSPSPSLAPPSAAASAPSGASGASGAPTPSSAGSSRGTSGAGGGVVQRGQGTLAPPGRGGSSLPGPPPTGPSTGPSSTAAEASVRLRPITCTRGEGTTEVRLVADVTARGASHVAARSAGWTAAHAVATGRHRWDVAWFLRLKGEDPVTRLPGAVIEVDGRARTVRSSDDTTRVC